MQGPSGSTPDGRQAGNTTRSSVNAGFNGFAFNPNTFQMQGPSGSTPDGRQAGNTTRSSLTLALMDLPSIRILSRCKDLQDRLQMEDKRETQLDLPYNAGFNGFAFNPNTFQMQGPSGSTPDGRQAGNTTRSSLTLALMDLPSIRILSRCKDLQDRLQMEDKRATYRGTMQPILPPALV